MNFILGKRLEISRLNSYIFYVFLFCVTLPSNLWAGPSCVGIPTKDKVCVAVTDKNVLGEDLLLCCNNPVTGFYRTGFCQTGERDIGVHTVCAQVTDEFLRYSRDKGNDLITPIPEFDFPGLKDGDKWCLCAGRWLEAEKDGFAPPVFLGATHEKSLEVIDLNVLKQYAIDLN